MKDGAEKIVGFSPGNAGRFNWVSAARIDQHSP